MLQSLEPAPVRAHRRYSRYALSEDERARLSSGPMFGLLPEAVQADVLQVATVHRLAHRDPVFLAGEVPEHWMVCCSGAVRVDYPRARGRANVLTYVEPGDWFGEVALCAGADWTHDAHAHGETTLLQVPRAHFFALLARLPALRDALMRVQHRKLQALSSVYDDLRVLPLRERLIKLLDHLVRDEGESLRLRLQQEDLARWLGASRQRVNLELKQLEREGCVRLGRAGVAVRDAEALANGRRPATTAERKRMECA